MKKTLVRILAMMLVMITVFMVAAPAMAEKVSSISQKSDANGDCKKTFYVKTSNAILAKVLPKTLKMTMTKGNLAATFYGSSIDVGFNLPDSYEITIWYWNAKTKKWVEENNYDIFCKKSKTITLKKANTYYKILVDSFGVTTTVNAYLKHNKIKYHSTLAGMNNYTFKWSKLPSWTIKNGAYCTLYKSNPVK